MGNNNAPVKQPPKAPQTTASGFPIVKNYRITRVLGQGAFGKVYHAEGPTPGQFRALKAITVKSKDQLESVLSEVALMRAFDHPHIAKCYDSFVEKDGTLYLVMELCDGDLDDIISGTY